MIDGIDGSELLPIMPFQVAPAAFPEWGRAGVDWVIIWVSSAAPRTLPGRSRTLPDAPRTLQDAPQTLQDAPRTLPDAELGGCGVGWWWWWR